MEGELNIEREAPPDYPTIPPGAHHLEVRGAMPPAATHHGGAADMRVMLVREIVEIDEFGSGGFEEPEEVFADDRLAGVAHGLAGMAELGHEGVLADHGGGVLLTDTFRGDLVVGPDLELAGARGASAVCGGDAAEPAVGPFVAGEAAVGFTRPS